jgi:hypothetical protein
MPRTPEVRRIDSKVERRRFLYVLGEALERAHRLGQILERQRVFVRAEHSQEQSTSALDTLADYLDKHRQNLTDNSGRIASLIRGKKLNEGEQSAVIGAVEILIVGLLHVHELLLLLPRETAKPQASFLLRDCSGRKDLKLSIVLTNLLSAYEYRFEDVLEKVNIEQTERALLTQGGNVLCQAFADKDNPLAWAVLAHEYGHTLNDSGTISQEIVFGKGVNKRSEPKGNLKLEWPAYIVAETVADFVAAYMLGPASLIPILFVEMMQPTLRRVKKISAGHPPTPLRVRLVLQYLKSLGVSAGGFEPVFDAYELDYSRKLQDMEEGERKKVEVMGKEAKKLLSPLVNMIATKIDSLGLRRFTESNAANARTLRKTLASRLPISSRRLQSDGTILAGLSSLKRPADPERVYRILAKLDEQPVPSSEILTAGWLHKLSSFEDALMNTFPQKDGHKTDLRLYGKYIEKMDELLLKSLEVAEVLDEVRRRLATHEDYAAF